jgi:hypothetical protein
MRSLSVPRSSGEAKASPNPRRCSSRVKTIADSGVKGSIEHVGLDTDSEAGPDVGNKALPGTKMAEEPAPKAKRKRGRSRQCGRVPSKSRSTTQESVPSRPRPRGRPAGKGKARIEGSGRKCAALSSGDDDEWQRRCDGGQD